MKKVFSEPDVSVLFMAIRDVITTSELEGGDAEWNDKWDI